MDKLKALNSKLGHQGGDQVIIELSKILKKHFKRESDVVGLRHKEANDETEKTVLARAGSKGDEFYLAAQVEDLKNLKDKLEYAREDFAVSAEEIAPGFGTGVSFGIAKIGEMLEDTKADKVMIEKGNLNVIVVDKERMEKEKINSSDIVMKTLKVAEMRMNADKRARGQERKD
jgi:GGDEF domain-containing protein